MEANQFTIEELYRVFSDKFSTIYKYEPYKESDYINFYEPFMDFIDSCIRHEFFMYKERLRTEMY